MARSRGWTAGIAALLYLNALFFAVAVTAALAAAGVRTFDSFGAGVVGGAAGAAVAFIVMVVGLSGFATAPLCALVARRALPQNAWRAACFGAAIGMAPSILNLPAKNLGLGVAAGITVVAAALLGLRGEPRRPLLSGAIVPGLALVGTLGFLTVQGAFEGTRRHGNDLENALEEIAERDDLVGLQAALDGMSPATAKLTGEDLDQPLELLSLRGDHLAAMEMILRHRNTPKTPCLTLLRAVLDDNAAAFEAAKGPVQDTAFGEFCAQIAVYLAAREHSGALLLQAISLMPVESVYDRPLFSVTRAKDDAAAMRLLGALGALDETGRVKPSLLAVPAFQQAVKYNENPDFYVAHCHRDELLVLLAATHDQAIDVDRVLDAGARVNARLSCGATPLTAALQASSSNVVEALLAAGADPNLPGTGFCFEADGGSAEAPLWILAHKLKGEWSTEAGSELELLVKHGAKTKVKSAQGQTLSAALHEDLRRSLDPKPAE